jgi:hypothetical protein
MEPLGQAVPWANVCTSLARYMDDPKSRRPFAALLRGNGRYDQLLRIHDTSFP